MSRQQSRPGISYAEIGISDECKYDVEWINSFWTAQGHCGACKKNWNQAATEMCPCGEKQTMSHVVDSCPPSKLNGGLSQLHSADDEAVAWLISCGS